MKPLTGILRASIQRKIAFWSGLCLLSLSLVIILIAASSLREAAIEAAKQHAVAVAEENVVNINEEIEIALNTARTLGQVMMAAKDPEEPVELTRDEVMLILRKVLRETPQIAGVFTIWEPNAFDGNDAAFAGTFPYGADGRFTVSWGRDARGELHVTPRVGYEDQVDGYFYQCPKTTRLECVTEPYRHTVYQGGEETLIVSLAVPVIIQGEFLGAVGVDIKLDYFQSLADSVNIYEGTGRLALISNDLTLLAVTGRPELVGMPADSVIPRGFLTDAQREAIRQGELVAGFGNHDNLEIIVPIQFWRTLMLWAVSVAIPREKITADANRLMWEMIGIGGGLMVIALGVMMFIAHQIALPIRKITKAAQEVAQGDLDVVVSTHLQDEIGTLANAFNRMIGRLREMIANEQQSREKLQQQNAEQQRLLDLVIALETPIIPLREGLLLAPVVGALDSERVNRLTEKLLQEVYTRNTRQVVLDITGVTAVDTQVVQSIGRLTQALQLLGCQVILTGISTEVALTITHLGVSLHGVKSTHSLQAALRDLAEEEAEAEHQDKR